VDIAAEISERGFGDGDAATSTRLVTTVGRADQMT